ncbi:MAG: PP2C family protein-serine/threonine phosphatase [Lachnospiraceae bacterium]
MEIFASFGTSKGNYKKINQDSLSVKVVNTPRGKSAFAIVCDGMGGLEQGELASKEVVIAFNNWFATDFARMVAKDSFRKDLLFEQWQGVVESLNDRISSYASGQDMMMGTTVVVILIYNDSYYVCHVGDSRIYKLDSELCQLTLDQSVVAQEVRMGRLTEEEAKVDPRRSVLLQCIGASMVIEPQYESGLIKEDTVFLLCSDGFVHFIDNHEIQANFSPGRIHDKDHGELVCEHWINTVTSRGEKDNITVVAVVVNM